MSGATTGSDAPATSRWRWGRAACIGALLVATAVVSSSAAAFAQRSAAPTRRPGRLSRSGLRVVSVSPRPGAAAANGAEPVVVQMSGTLSQASPRPALTPRIAGHWEVVGARFVFTPAGAFAPGTRVTLTVPAGRAGVLDAGGHRLARRASFSWSIGSLGVVRAEQILAELDYLPVRFRPTVPGPLQGYALSKAVFDPPAGKFVWDWKAPAPLRALWSPGRPTVVLTGALMAFQSKLGLPVSGVLDPDTVAGLLEAARDPSPALDRMGYRYALAVESSPETFTLYQNGRVVLTSPANTGIPEAPTSIGTYPVYLRLATQVMMGTEPDGAHYADPVAWVAYFYGGEAVHYIARYDYGYPQSLGCVELPWDAAEQAWPLLGIGTLVTVAP